MTPNIGDANNMRNEKLVVSKGQRQPSGPRVESADGVGIVEVRSAGDAGLVARTMTSVAPGSAPAMRLPLFETA